MLRRMAHTAGPEAIFKYLVSARRERDGLRDALVSKLVVQVSKVELGKHDILALRWPGTPKPEVLGALEELRSRLRQKYGWEGDLLVLTSGAEASAIPMTERDVLVVRYEDPLSDDERARVMDMVGRMRRERGWAGEAMVTHGPVDVSAARTPEVRYDDRGKLDEVVVDGALVKFVHLEYMDDDHVWLRIDLAVPGRVNTTRPAGEGERERELETVDGRVAIVVNLSTGAGGDEAKGDPIDGLAETE